MTTWLVTGATSGIGRSVTEQLLERGDRVAALARRTATLDDLAERFGDALWRRPVDLTDTPALRLAVDSAFRDLGQVDVVLSNAGLGSFGAAEEVSDEVIDQQLAINLVGPIQLVRAALPHLRRQGGGRIIQTSSMGAQITTPGGSIYHATKWGIEGFLESVMGEVAGFGIGMTLVEPGIVRTSFGSSLSIADPSPDYADTPVGQVRSYIEASDGDVTGAAPGDPVRVAQAIIDLAARAVMPRRLALGTDAYESIRDALALRSSELESERHLAPTADFPLGA